MKRVIGIGALVALLGVFAPALASADGTVGVELAEFSVTPDTATVEEGAVTFNVNNVGSFGHELVVVRTDLAADALTEAGEGQADEAALEVVGEVRPALGSGESQTVTLNLAAGNYALICNIFNPDFAPGHYGRGMSAALTVTAAAPADSGADDAAADDSADEAAPAPPAAGGAGFAGSDGAATPLVAGLALAALVAVIGGARILGARRS